MPGALWTWKARRRGVVSSDGWVDAVIIEVGGRWFLTDTFVDNPGEELDPSSDPAHIGKAVRRWLRDRPRRPGLADPKPDGDAWERFLRDVQGTSGAEIVQRERSLLVASRGKVFQCQDELGGPDAMRQVADDDLAVGTLVVEQMGRLPARSPIVARASVTELDGDWRVMATRGLQWTRHLHTAEPADLVAAVAAALDTSTELGERELGSGDAFEPGTSERELLHEAAWVRVGRRKDGGLVVFGDSGILDVTPDELIAVVRSELATEVETAAPPPPRAEGGFGPKSAWLAVSGVDAAGLVDALGLVDTLPIDAADGIAWAQDEGVIVLPPIDGWVLAAGFDLAMVEAFDVAGLSRRLDTVVQAFRTHRVVELHEWTWAERGEIKRSARFLGESDPEWRTIGAATPVEEDVGLPEDPTEDDVFTVAGAWSVDPTRLPSLRDVDATWGRLP